MKALFRKADKKIEKRKVGLMEYFDMILVASDKELKSVELTDEAKRQFITGTEELRKSVAACGISVKQAVESFRAAAGLLNVLTTQKECANNIGDSK